MFCVSWEIHTRQCCCTVLLLSVVVVTLPESTLCFKSQSVLQINTSADNITCTYNCNSRVLLVNGNCSSPIFDYIANCARAFFVLLWANIMMIRAYFKKNLVLHTEELNLEGTMASAEREPYTVVWGWSPQRGPGSEPLLREPGAKPLCSWWHFWLKVHFLRSCGILHWCNGRTVQQICKFGPKVTHPSVIWANVEYRNVELVRHDL